MQRENGLPQTMMMLSSTLFYSCPVEKFNTLKINTFIYTIQALAVATGRTFIIRWKTTLNISKRNKSTNASNLDIDLSYIPAFNTFYFLLVNFHKLFNAYVLVNRKSMTFFLKFILSILLTPFHHDFATPNVLRYI